MLDEWKVEMRMCDIWDIMNPYHEESEYHEHIQQTISHLYDTIQEQNGFETEDDIDRNEMNDTSVDQQQQVSSTSSSTTPLHITLLKGSCPSSGVHFMASKLSSVTSSPHVMMICDTDDDDSIDTLDQVFKKG